MLATSLDCFFSPSPRKVAGGFTPRPLSTRCLGIEFQNPMPIAQDPKLRVPAVAQGPDRNPRLVAKRVRSRRANRAADSTGTM